MSGEGPWDALAKFFDLVKLLVIVALIGAVGYGLLNADRVLKVMGQALELLKAAR
jgi:hypothetical protein